MKLIFAIIGWLLAMTGAVIGFIFRTDHVRLGGVLPRPTQPVTIQQMLTIQRIEPLARLITHRVPVVDVVKARLGGYTGSATAMVLVKGDVLVQVDLSKARVEQVDQVHQHARLCLPQPQVTEARVDHERTRIVAITENGLWQFVPGGRDTDARAIELAMCGAQRRIGDAARQPDTIAQARQRAEDLLRDFCSALGWEITFEWDGGAQ